MGLEQLATQRKIKLPELELKAEKMKSQKNLGKT